MATDFRSVLGALSAAGVEFILVGGLAAQAHGSARLTQDIDVVYGRSDANLARLASALEPHTPYLRGAPPGLPFHLDVPTLCGGSDFDTDTFAATGGGFAKIFDVQNKRFSTVTCKRCSYTEIYRSETSTLGNIFDFFTN